MPKYIGLEWASKGWFGVVLDGGEGWQTDLFPSLLSVWKYHSDASRILLDAPIGLPSDGRRACDAAAREKLRRGRGVFYAPVRAAVYEGNVREAREINEAAGFSIQNSTWSVVPRIREVDEFLDVYPGARDRLVETRPEVCFYALNGRTPVGAAKTTAEGRARRKALLAEEHPEAAAIYERAVDRYASPAYAPTVGDPEDVLDALVAAVTARRGAEGCSTLPEAPPTDERGLPMRIVYPTETAQTRLSALETGG